jgi:hypothetical protein
MSSRRRARVQCKSRRDVRMTCLFPVTVGTGPGALASESGVVIVGAKEGQCSVSDYLLRAFYLIC